MDRFVRASTGGGVAVVAGLWLVELSHAGSVPWVVGALLVAIGSMTIAYGIGTEINRPVW